MNAGQDDLAKARVGESLERVEDASWLDAARSSARGRHDTEAAELVASLLQLQERAGAAFQRDSAEFDRGALLAQVGDHHPPREIAHGGTLEIVGASQSDHGVD